MIEFKTADGVKRGLKFGTYTFELINQITGTTTVEEVFEKLKVGEPGFATLFYFACAKHYAMSQKLPVDFEPVHVADWLDEMGPEWIANNTAELFRAYLEKNRPAPKTGQSESEAPQPLEIGKLQQLES